MQSVVGLPQSLILKPVLLILESEMILNFVNNQLVILSPVI